MGCMYVGVEQREKEKNGKRRHWREFVEWQVAHFQKKLQKIQNEERRTEKKTVENAHKFRQTDSFGKVERKRTNSCHKAGDPPDDGHVHRGIGASGRACCQCIPKLAREKSIKKKLSQRDRFASHRIVSSRVEYLKTHLLRNIFDNCLRKHSRRTSRMSRCRIYLAGQRMRLFH